MSRYRWSPSRQLEPSPPPRLSDRCRISYQTFDGPAVIGGYAPKPAVPPGRYRTVETDPLQTFVTPSISRIGSGYVYQLGTFRILPKSISLDHSLNGGREASSKGRPRSFPRYSPKVAEVLHQPLARPGQMGSGNRKHDVRRQDARAPNEQLERAKPRPATAKSARRAKPMRGSK